MIDVSMARASRKDEEAREQAVRRVVPRRLTWRTGHVGCSDLDAHSGPLPAMLKLLTDLRSSFWFIPALMVAFAATLAVGALELDAVVGDEALTRYPRLFGAGAEGTRQLLSTIAGSTITVAGVVFSITIVALSLAASQYSPRVLRGFMRDRANQLVLGVFVGVYVYCLIVLRTIRGGEEGFVPGISVLLALVLALTGIGFLIFFIHHIASSIQVSEMAGRISRQTIEAIRARCAEGGEDRGRTGTAGPPEGAAWHVVRASSTGYIQRYDIDRLLAFARERKCAIRMARSTGDFVIEGEALLNVTGEEPADEEARALNAACVINTYRDISQDPAFGVQQLVDIALKALSPGVNDTATARNSLDYLTSILFSAANRDVDEVRRFVQDGRLLLIVEERTLGFFIESTFDPIRRYALDNVDMMLHTLQALERVAREARSSACHASVAKQLAAIEEAVAGTKYVAVDRTRLDEATRRVSRALGTG